MTDIWTIPLFEEDFSAQGRDKIIQFYEAARPEIFTGLRVEEANITIEFPRPVMILKVENPDQIEMEIR